MPPPGATESPPSAPLPASWAAWACWRAYPTWRDKVPCGHWTDQGVVTDGPFTTARGLGFAIDLGLELVRLLVSPQEALSVKERIQHPDC